MTTLLQITRHHLRLLQGQWPELSGCFQIERNSALDLRQELGRLIKESRLKISEAVVLLPRSDVFCKGLVLPSRQEDEIKRMIEVQIPMLVPFDINQTVFDYHMNISAGDEQSEILLGIAPQDCIAASMTDLEAEEISVQDAFLTSDGIDRFIKRFLPDRLSPAKAVAFLFSDTQMSEMVVYEGLTLKASYYLPYGLADIPDRLDEFCREMVSCLKSLTREGRLKKSVSVVLAGFSNDDGMTKALAEAGSIEAEGMELSDILSNAAGPDLRLPGPVSAWAPLLGFYTAGTEKPLFSFLPAGALSKKEKKARRKKKLHLAAALLCAAGLAVGVFGVQQAGREKYLRAIEQQIKGLQPQIEQADQQQKFFAMALQNAGSPSVVEAVREIYELLPEDVFLGSFVMRGTTFELLGSTLRSDSVNELQRALVSSSSFQNAALEYATKRRRFKEEFTEFKINVELVTKGKS